MYSKRSSAGRSPRSAHNERSFARPERNSTRKPSRPARPSTRDEKREQRFPGETVIRVSKKTKTSGPWQKSAYLPEYALRPNVKPLDYVPPKKLNPKKIDAEQNQTENLTSGERLQKVLARAGIASRRKAELLILEGAVTVNGTPVVELGTRVDAKKDKIKVNGSLIFTEVEPIYMALYKPKGMISAMSDPEGRNHLGMLTDHIRERVLPIGRLNYNSEGLLLLTNDGELAEKISKSKNIPKVYMVKIKGHPTEEHLEILKRGIFTAEGVIRFNHYGVEQTLKNKSWLKLEVAEGSKLDLRELLNQRGLLVDRIVRTAIGTVSVQGLEPGQYRFMKKIEFEKLLESTH